MSSVEYMSSDSSALPSRVGTGSLFEVPKHRNRRVSISDYTGGLDYDEVGGDSDFDVPAAAARAAVQMVVPAVTKMVPLDVGTLATVSAIWEGVVVSIKDNEMHVRLTDRQGILPAHSADVSLDFVHDQDVELVKPGAVFYWTLYRAQRRGAISATQEIRFRRLPNWTKAQIKKVYEDADELASKFKTRNKIAD